MSFFLKKPHLGKKRCKVELKIRFHELRFTRNEYFLTQSRYALFAENDHRHKVRTKRSLMNSHEAEVIPLHDEELVMVATLYQEKAGSSVGFDKQLFEEKEKRIMVRQITVLSPDDEVYADVGYLLLPLNRIVAESSDVEYTFDLNDPENNAEAAVNCTIAYRFLTSEQVTDSFQDVLEAAQIKKNDAENGSAEDGGDDLKPQQTQEEEEDEDVEVVTGNDVALELASSASGKQLEPDDKSRAESDDANTQPKNSQKAAEQLQFPSDC